MSDVNAMRTYLNCTWAERRMMVNGPIWLDGWQSRWYCLALSGRARRPIEVQPDRCARCPFWQPRAEARVSSSPNTTARPDGRSQGGTP
jgi:hypothetical protein